MSPWFRQNRRVLAAVAIGLAFVGLSFVGLAFGRLIYGLWVSSDTAARIAGSHVGAVGPSTAPDGPSPANPGPAADRDAGPPAQPSPPVAQDSPPSQGLPDAVVPAPGGGPAVTQEVSPRQEGAPPVPGDAASTAGPAHGAAVARSMPRRLEDRPGPSESRGSPAAVPPAGDRPDQIAANPPRSAADAACPAAQPDCVQRPDPRNFYGPLAPKPPIPDTVPEAGADQQDLFSWKFDGQIYAYGQALERTSNSLINPQNKFAGLANSSLFTELRPNIKGTSSYLDLYFQPRAYAYYESGGIQEQHGGGLFLNQGYARIKPFADLDITAGRELISWGPSIFRSPSSPYYFNNNRLNPITEISGIDLTKISYAFSPEWSATGGVVYDSGHNQSSGYGHSAFAKLDYVSEDYLASMTMASLRYKPLFLGGYAQATVSDAILAYGEFNVSAANELDYAVDPNTNAFKAFRNYKTSATALIGGSYTFTNGHSVLAEYLYNGPGYSGNSLKNFFVDARRANVQLQLGESAAAIGAETIGFQASRSRDLLGQHYLYLQYQSNPSQSDQLWRLSASQNLIDHSTQFSAYLEQSISSYASLFAFGVANVGSRDTDFGSLFRFSILSGVKFFVF